MLLAAATTGIQVGAAIVASRAVVADVGAIPLALLRYLIGAGILVPLALVLRRSAVRTRDFAPIALLGVAQFAVVVVLLNYALELIPAARAALLFATTPLFVLILEAAHHRRRLGFVTVSAVLVTIAGAAAALSQDPLGPTIGVHGWLGEISALVSALCAAICSVFYRPYLRRYPALVVGAIAMLASVGALALVTPLASLARLAALRPEAWFAIGFIGISSGVGYWLWLLAFEGASATDVSMFLALSPLTAVALGTLLLGEPLTARFAFGVALVVLGLGLAQRPRSPSALRHRHAG